MARTVRSHLVEAGDAQARTRVEPLRVKELVVGEIDEDFLQGLLLRGAETDGNPPV
jgi:hypothetical protein